MKSRVKNSPTPPELKTLIYEQTGKVGEITAKTLSDLVQAYFNAHPEEIEEIETQKGEFDYAAKRI